MDLALGVFFFSSGGVTEGLIWDVGVAAAFCGCVRGEEFLAAADFLPFFSTTLLGVKSSRAGGSFSGVPSSPGEKDRKEQ